MENLRKIYVQLVRFGEALENVKGQMNKKNFYAYNPSFDRKRMKK